MRLQRTERQLEDLLKTNEALQVRNQLDRGDWMEAWPNFPVDDTTLITGIIDHYTTDCPFPTEYGMPQDLGWLPQVSLASRR